MNDSENPQFNRLLARYLESVDSGVPLDRDQLMAEHPEHADALSRYFDNVTIVEQLVQPRRPSIDATVTRLPANTQPTRNDQTVIRGGGDSETSVVQQNQAASTVSSSGSRPIPKQFGRYKVESCLGQGAMGAVYLAHDTQLDRRVALKIPKFTDDSNGELLKRFYREARAAATLRSPNICPVFDVGEIDGQHYITMAFIEGRPLRDFTKSKKTQPEKQIAVIIRKLALALEEAHEIGVIHRDLKPANIMMDKKGEPVVMDFGLARRSSSNSGTADDVLVTQSGAIIGTPAYMSPEQVAGDQALIGARSDIYSLGIILYELITGEMPFQGNLMSLLQQIALNNPTKPSELRKEVDPRLESICLKMIAGDQSQRYQSMKDVAADLETVLRNPAKRQKKEQAAATTATPTSLSTANDESNPILISVPQMTSGAAQMREKENGRTGKGNQPAPAKGKQFRAGSSGPPKMFLVVGGIGGVLLLLFGITFLVRVGKYDVQITLDDPAITLSIDGDALKITDDKDIYKLSAGEHELKLEKENFTTHVEDFTVTKDGKTVLKVAIVNGKLDGLLNGEKPKTGVPPQKIVKTSEPLPTQPTVTIPTVEGGIYPGNFALSFPERGGNYVEMSGLDSNLMNELLRDKKRHLTIEFWLKRDRQKISPHDLFAGWSEDSVVVRSGAGSEYIEGGEWGGRGAPPVIFYAATAPTRTLKDEANWMHVAAVLDNPKEYWLFIDGKLVDRKPGKWGWPGSKLPFRLMDRAGGMIGETRISTVARYDKDFTPEFGFKPDADTLAIYHFDEGTGEILKDSSGNGHDGKIVGAKWVNPGGMATRTSVPPAAVAPFDEAQAKQHQQAWAKHLGGPVEYENSIGMKFRLIPPGEFLMGSTPEEIEAALKLIPYPNWREHIESEGPQHKVVLTKPIYVGVTEVTQAQYEQVMGTNPSSCSATGIGKDAVANLDTANFPVETVSWNDAVEFCSKLSKQEQRKPFYLRSGETVTLLEGTGYRLPTDAEWEYACRAETTTRTWSGDDDRDLNQVAWSKSNGTGRSHVVGELKVNPFGLWDVHGNVFEWVQDGWDPKFSAQFQDKIAIDSSSPFPDRSHRPFRGGDWNTSPPETRSSYRLALSSSARVYYVGFRVVLVVGTVSAIVPEPQPAPTTTPDRAVSFVESLGGKVIRDDNAPDKPVTRIDLAGTKVTDAGLKELAPFNHLNHLNHLNLEGTQVTDAGIEELQKALPKCQIVK